MSYSGIMKVYVYAASLALAKGSMLGQAITNGTSELDIFINANSTIDPESNITIDQFLELPITNSTMNSIFETELLAKSDSSPALGDTNSAQVLSVTNETLEALDPFAPNLLFSATMENNGTSAVVNGLNQSSPEAELTTTLFRVSVNGAPTAPTTTLSSVLKVKQPPMYPGYTIPTNKPTIRPTKSPTSFPKKSPTPYPAYALSPAYPVYGYPMGNPSSFPTKLPTKRPIQYITKPPSSFPTHAGPTRKPSMLTTNLPSKIPTSTPTLPPTKQPSKAPTNLPTKFPTPNPTKAPTNKQSNSPTKMPTKMPTKLSTLNPTLLPTKRSSNSPTKSPILPPTRPPILPPTKSPTNRPSSYLSKSPISIPTLAPTKQPFKTPTNFPTKLPTPKATQVPTNVASRSPTEMLTYLPCGVNSTKRSYCVKNRATCEVNSTTGEFFCRCILGYNGPECRSDIDECQTLPYPCAGGDASTSTCVNYFPPKRYKCECKPGFKPILPENNSTFLDPVPIEWRPTSCIESDSYSLPKLPYAADALEPYIDTTTMNIHLGRHHATYVTNINRFFQGKPKPDILDLQANALEAGTAVRNNGGGHYNHALFWEEMTDPKTAAKTKPSPKLMDMMDGSFGNFASMKVEFEAKAAPGTTFGSGWVWLCVTADGRQLKIVNTANQDNPLMKGLLAEGVLFPILGLDVWEHAYYLKYQNRRTEYVANWWKVVNWDKVNENFNYVLENGTGVKVKG